MGKYVFNKSRSFNDTLKSLYTHLCRDITPAGIGVIILYVAYGEKYDNNRPDVASWYLIAGIVFIIYALFRFWKLYKNFSSTRIKSFTLDEKGIHIDFTKYPFKMEARWKDIDLIEYFAGSEDEGIVSTVEYFEYTDILGRFKDFRGVELNYGIRIMNGDWKTEQGEELFHILLKLEGSNEKLKTTGRPTL